MESESINNSKFSKKSAHEILRFHVYDIPRFYATKNYLKYKYLKTRHFQNSFST